MHRLRRLTLVLLLGLAACATPYRFGEYVIAPERIPAFPTGSAVQIVNDQPSTEEHVIYRYGARKWVGTWHAATEALVAQLGKEIVKRGGHVSPDAPKVLRVAVLHMEADGGFAFRVKQQVRVQLGQSPPRELAVPNTSPANLYMAVDGAIARAVIQLLTDAEVLEYLRANDPG